MDNFVQDAVTSFFDQFVAAFRSFDGNEIAQRYLSPYLAMQADGTIACFSQHSDIAHYSQTVLDDYYAKGCRSCRYKELEVVSMGASCVLGTVTWELLHEDGRVLSEWRESYNLSLVGDRVRVFASVDHVG